MLRVGRFFRFCKNLAKRLKTAVKANLWFFWAFAAANFPSLKNSWNLNFIHFLNPKRFITKNSKTILKLLKNVKFLTNFSSFVFFKVGFWISFSKWSEFLPRGAKMSKSNLVLTFQKNAACERVAKKLRKKLKKTS